MNSQSASSRRIVVGVDGSESSRQALAWAAGQAERTGARLQVVSAWHFPVRYGTPPVLEVDLEGDTRRIVVDMVRDLRSDHRDVTIDVEIVAGHPTGALVDASDGADLLVVGSRGHGSLVGCLIGSVSLYCVHHAHCPVVVHRTL